jgi:hypothetical protein
MKTKQQTIDLFNQMGIQFDVNESLGIIEVHYQRNETYKGRRFTAYYCDNETDTDKPWKVMRKGGKNHIKYCKTKIEAIDLINLLEA